jgi:RNA polymerase sigma factor (sigma-70 family)
MQDTHQTKQELTINADITTLDIPALFEKHQQHLFRFVQRYVRNPEDAEDVVQNTFLEAVRCADRFSGLSKPSTWLFGIALNLARNQVRRNCAMQCDSVEDSFIEQIADLHADPASVIEQRQIVRMVEAHLAQLPQKIRTTFEAVLEGECSYEQAATMLEVPIGTIRSRVSRVRSTIRSQFA